MTITLPVSVLEASNLHEDDEIAIEVVGDCIMLIRATSDFEGAWEAYESVEPHYREANRRLAE